MSGGIAYVWDPDRQLQRQCNHTSVNLEPVEDVDRLLELVQHYGEVTGSQRALALLANWPEALSQFVQIMESMRGEPRAAFRSTMSRSSC